MRADHTRLKQVWLNLLSNAMEQDLARGMAAGFADYVTKPIDVGRLLRVVEELAFKKR